FLFLGLPRFCKHTCIVGKVIFFLFKTGKTFAKNFLAVARWPYKHHAVGIAPPIRAFFVGFVM
ncbi:hypothetical protein ACVGWG_00800, partial [Enterobacter asburiae]